MKSVQKIILVLAIIFVFQINLCASHRMLTKIHKAQHSLVAEQQQKEDYVIEDEKKQAELDHLFVKYAFKEQQAQKEKDSIELEQRLKSIKGDSKNLDQDQAKLDQQFNKMMNVDDDDEIPAFSFKQVEYKYKSHNKVTKFMRFKEQKDAAKPDEALDNKLDKQQEDLDKKLNYLSIKKAKKAAVKIDEAQEKAIDKQQEELDKKFLAMSFKEQSQEMIKADPKAKLPKKADVKSEPTKNISEDSLDKRQNELDKQFFEYSFKQSPSKAAKDAKLAENKAKKANPAAKPVAKASAQTSKANHKVAEKAVEKSTESNDDLEQAKLDKQFDKLMERRRFKEQQDDKQFNKNAKASPKGKSTADFDKLSSDLDKQQDELDKQWIRLSFKEQQKASPKKSQAIKSKAAPQISSKVQEEEDEIEKQYYLLSRFKESKPTTETNKNKSKVPTDDEIQKQDKEQEELDKQYYAEARFKDKSYKSFNKRRFKQFDHAQSTKPYLHGLSTKAGSR